MTASWILLFLFPSSWDDHPEEDRLPGMSSCHEVIHIAFGSFIYVLHNGGCPIYTCSGIAAKSGPMRACIQIHGSREARMGVAFPHDPKLIH